MQRLTSIISPLLSGLGLILAVVVLNFLLIHFSPGDPVEVGFAAGDALALPPV